jgi:hypothetical protein
MRSIVQVFDDNPTTDPQAIHAKNRAKNTAESPTFAPPSGKCVHAAPSRECRGRSANAGGNHRVDNEVISDGASPSILHGSNSSVPVDHA